MKRRLASIALSLALILLAGVSTASAVEAEAAFTESMTVTYLEGGLYLVTTLRIYVSPAAPAGAATQVSGTKTANLYNGSMEKLCSLTVEGTFSFDGHSSKALSASYSYAAYSVVWSFAGGDAYCGGNTAYATGTFERFGIQPTILSVSLSCSADGVLS